MKGFGSLYSLGGVMEIERPTESLIEEFFWTSRPAIEALAARIRSGGFGHPAEISMFCFRDGHQTEVMIPPGKFLLRTSVEYANPQLTLEELQGIVIARILEVTGAFVAHHPHLRLDAEDIHEMARLLEEPPLGEVVPFLLNVDDIEADRYSINPFRRSIVESGQSAKAVALVKTEGLHQDPDFFARYSNSLVTTLDSGCIEAHLKDNSASRYIDLVDSVKYDQLQDASAVLGMDLAIPALRMPLTTLNSESPYGPLHRIISAIHVSARSLDGLFRLLGPQVMSAQTFLPVVPHAADGTSSKRLAHGRYSPGGPSPERLEVSYRSGRLYPNEVNRRDVSRATADDHVTVSWSDLASFDYRRTPVSPQFALYMLASPENGAIWHGLGVYGGSRIVDSYRALHHACAAGEPFAGLPVECRPDPLQLDLVAAEMLRHPVYHNIDASVSCHPNIVRGLLRAMALRVVPGPFPSTETHSAQLQPRPNPPSIRALLTRLSIRHPVPDLTR